MMLEILGPSGTRSGVRTERDTVQHHGPFILSNYLPAWIGLESVEWTGQLISLRVKGRGATNNRIDRPAGTSIKAGGTIVKNFEK
jgi:hypothetical protein